MHVVIKDQDTIDGWMELYTFKDWFFTLFLPYAKRLQGKKVLIGDNLASHFNMNVIVKCEKSDNTLCVCTKILPT